MKDKWICQKMKLLRKRIEKALSRSVEEGTEVGFVILKVEDKLKAGKRIIGRLGEITISSERENEVGTFHTHTPRVKGDTPIRYVAHPSFEDLKSLAYFSGERGHEFLCIAEEVIDISAGTLKYYVNLWRFRRTSRAKKFVNALLVDPVKAHGMIKKGDSDLIKRFCKFSGEID